MKFELRHWTTKDLEGLSFMMNGINRSYLSDGLPNPYTVKSGKWWLENVVFKNEGTEGIYRAIIVEDKIVGMISLTKKIDVYRKDAEISYVLADKYWGNGITTEAVKVICQLAFEQLDIIRITGVIFGPNEASRKVLLKCGFTPEGTLKDAIYKNGKVMDLCYFGLYK